MLLVPMLGRTRLLRPLALAAALGLAILPAGTAAAREAGQMSRADSQNRAARFIMRRDEPGWSETDAAELKAWLDESMAHKAAYWRLVHGWEQAGRIAALGRGYVEPEARRWRPHRKVLIATAAMFIGVLVVGPPLVESISTDRPAGMAGQA